MGARGSDVACVDTTGSVAPHCAEVTPRSQSAIQMFAAMVLALVPQLRPAARPARATACRMAYPAAVAEILMDRFSTCFSKDVGERDGEVPAAGRCAGRKKFAPAARSISNLYLTLSGPSRPLSNAAWEIRPRSSAGFLRHDF